MAPKVSRRSIQQVPIEDQIFQRFDRGHKYVIVEVDAAEKPTRIVSSAVEEEVALSTRDSLESQHPEADLRIVRKHAWKNEFVFLTRRLNV